MPESTKKYVLSAAAGRSDQVIEIGGREFRADPFTLKEANRFETGANTYKQQLEAIAEPLSSRSLDGEEVTTDFLEDNITRPFLQKLLSLLVNGELEDNPKV